MAHNRFAHVVAQFSNTIAKEKALHGTDPKKAPPGEAITVVARALSPMAILFAILCALVASE